MVINHCKNEKKTKTNLFHSAGGASVPFGPHELERRGPLAENWICQNVQPIHFNQNCGMTQPGDSQTWTRVREVRVLDKVRFHHWQLTVEGLGVEERG